MLARQAATLIRSPPRSRPIAQIRQRLSQHWLLIAGLLLIVAVAALTLVLVSRPRVLRVAAGPAQSEDVRLITGLAQAFQREKSAIRLKLVLADDARKAAKLLDDGKADLAVARSDTALPEQGLTAVVMRRAVAIIVARTDRNIGRVADLRGRAIGVPKDQPDNLKLLTTVLSHYEFAEDAVRIVPLEPDERAPALRDGRIDAMFLVGSTLSRPLSDSLAGITRAIPESGLSFLPIREAEAIAARNPALESAEIVAGAFGGEPSRPAETVDTVSITYRLMASRDLSDSLVGDLTRQILEARLALAAELPQAQGIEAPATERNAALAAHPGAAAYIDGDQQTFFETYGDWFYLAVMVMSVLGSGAAAMISRMNSRRRADAMAGLTRLISILREARHADDEAALAALETEADAILNATLELAARGDLDEAALSAYRLAVDQTSRGIVERRQILARETPAAAE